MAAQFFMRGYVNTAGEVALRNSRDEAGKQLRPTNFQHWTEQKLSSIYLELPDEPTFPEPRVKFEGFTKSPIPVPLVIMMLAFWMPARKVHVEAIRIDLEDSIRKLHTNLGRAIVFLSLVSVSSEAPVPPRD